jgi:hypothetical protein
MTEQAGDEWPDQQRGCGECVRVHWYSEQTIELSWKKNEWPGPLWRGEGSAAGHARAVLPRHRDRLLGGMGQVETRVERVWFEQLKLKHDNLHLI